MFHFARKKSQSKRFRKRFFIFLKKNKKPFPKPLAKSNNTKRFTPPQSRLSRDFTIVQYFNKIFTKIKDTKDGSFTSI